MSMKSIIDNLWEGITFYVNERFKNAPFDKTDTAIIKGVSEFGYVIDYNKNLYADVRTIGGTCYINETVKIMIPQNNMNNIFIMKPPGADDINNLQQQIDQRATISYVDGNYVNNNKITNSGVINQDGFVVDGRQLNPSINNTLAWNIGQLKDNLNNSSYSINCKSGGVNVLDIRNNTITPINILDQSVFFGMANANDVGLTGGLILIMTIKPWVDESANSVQLAINLNIGSLHIRVGNNNTWNSWIEK